MGKQRLGMTHHDTKQTNTFWDSVCGLDTREGGVEFQFFFQKKKKKLLKHQTKPLWFAMTTLQHILSLSSIVGHPSLSSIPFPLCKCKYAPRDPSPLVPLAQSRYCHDHLAKKAMIRDMGEVPSRRRRHTAMTPMAMARLMVPRAPRCLLSASRSILMRSRRR